MPVGFYGETMERRLRIVTTFDVCATRIDTPREIARECIRRKASQKLRGHSAGDDIAARSAL